MGGFSWLIPRPAAAGGPTHALFAAQSHSIVDNLVALLRHSRAWNCSAADCIGPVPDQSFHSRFRVPSGHALMASVLLNLDPIRTSGSPLRVAIRNHPFAPSGSWPTSLRNVQSRRSIILSGDP